MTARHSSPIAYLGVPAYDWGVSDDAHWSNYFHLLGGAVVVDAFPSPNARTHAPIMRGPDG